MNIINITYKFVNNINNFYLQKYKNNNFIIKIMDNIDYDHN